MTLPVLEVLEDLQRDPAAFWLIEHVEAWHEADQTPRFDPGWFHCSALGKTDVELIADYRGERDQEQHAAGLLRIFDNGHGRDRDWKRYLRDSKLTMIGDEYSRRCQLDNLRLRGECDDIIRNPETGTPYIFEFKTINPYGFGQLRAPKSEHTMQVHCYMAATGIADAIVLYENKASQALLGFHVPFDLDIWAQITNRLKRLRRLAEDGLTTKASDSAKKQAAYMQM